MVSAGEIFNVADDAPLALRELRAFHGLAEDEDTPNNTDASPWDVVSDTRKIRVVLAYRPYYPTFFSAWAAGAL